MLENINIPWNDKIEKVTVQFFHLQKQIKF